MRTLKKHLALFLALAMVLSIGAVPAFASGEFAQIVLLDNDIVNVTITDYDPTGSYDDGPVFELLVENKGSTDVTVRLANASVNGVMCSPSWSEKVPSGKKTYSSMSWYMDDLQECGINYVQTVCGTLNVYDSETYDDILLEDVTWEAPVSDPSVPAVEPVQFTHGFGVQPVLTGDTAMSVVDYDPEGSYDGGPALIFYLENHTDRAVWFTVDDVSVNGFMCDPYWGCTVAPGMVAYSTCDWWSSDLEENHIDSVEEVEFTATAMDDATLDDITSATAVVDTVAGAPASAEQPAAPEAEQPAAPAAEQPAAPMAETGLLGAYSGNTYTNSEFGLTFAMPDDWTVTSEAELLSDMGMSVTSFAEVDQAGLDAFLEGSNAFVLTASSSDGTQNINMQILSTEGVGTLVTEDEMLTMVQSMDLGLEGATVEKNTFMFAGEEHPGLYMEYTDSSLGVDLTMYVQIVLLMEEDYALLVVMGSVFDNTNDEIGAMFTLAE